MPLSPQEIKTLTEKPFEFVERVGLIALELQPCYIKLKLPLAVNRNHIGSMYAGALFTLAEIPGGALYMTTFDVLKYYPVIKEMKICFLKPVKTDAYIEISMSKSEKDRICQQADQNGKAEFILTGEIKDEDNQIVATSHGVYQIRRHDL